MFTGLEFPCQLEKFVIFKFILICSRPIKLWSFRHSLHCHHLLSLSLSLQLPSLRWDQLLFQSTNKRYFENADFILRKNLIFITKIMIPNKRKIDVLYSIQSFSMVVYDRTSVPNKKVETPSVRKSLFGWSAEGELSGRK